jgi:hypothetical protein
MASCCWAAQQRCCSPAQAWYCWRAHPYIDSGFANWASWALFCGCFLPPSRCRKNHADADPAISAQIKKLTAEKLALESELVKLKSQQQQAPPARQPTPEDAHRNKDPNQVIDELTERQIAMIDQNLRKLLEERDKLQDDLQTMRKSFTPDHPRVKEQETHLKDVDTKIKDYVLQWRDMQKKLAEDGTANPLIGRRIPESKTAAAAVDAARVGGVQLDVVQLGNSLVDASGAVQIAKVKYQTASAVQKDGGQNALDMMTARVNLEVAQKRLTLLLGIAEVALKNAQDELSIGMQRFRTGLQTEQGLSELKSKVQMLELIINAAK